MLQALNALLAPAVMERLTLALNHVIGAERIATERLLPHAGRSVEVLLNGWPSLLPDPPPMAWVVTPAGLLEWRGVERLGAADLTLSIDASNPALLFAQLAAGERPTVGIDGDAALAGDVNWLMENLRWDVEADLERLFGPAVAPQLHKMGSALASGVRAAVRAAHEVRERFGSRGFPGTDGSP